MIVTLEGIDGSGKATQAEQLKAKFDEMRVAAQIMSFPRYNSNPFSKGIEWYLGGKFGSAVEVSPYLASLLYAGDRLGAKKDLLYAQATYPVVIIDRYVLSNVAHHAAKLPQEQRAAFVSWIQDIEYGVYELPRSDLTVYLRMPAEIAVELLATKHRGGTSDEHEINQEYLTECAKVYDNQLIGAPQTIVVDCYNKGALRHPGNITGEILKEIFLHVFKKHRTS